MKDVLGNTLAVGQRVQLKLGAPEIMGVIQAITNGGITTGMRGKGAEVSPAMVTIYTRFDIPVDPTNAVLTNVVRVHDPTEDGGTVEPPRLVSLEN